MLCFLLLVGGTLVWKYFWCIAPLAIRPVLKYFFGLKFQQSINFELKGRNISMWIVIEWKIGEIPFTVCWALSKYIHGSIECFSNEKNYAFMVPTTDKIILKKNMICSVYKWKQLDKFVCTYINAIISPNKICLWWYLAKGEQFLLVVECTILYCNKILPMFSV
jgi:hypothetical protein